MCIRDRYRPTPNYSPQNVGTVNPQREYLCIETNYYTNVKIKNKFYIILTTLNKFGGLIN